MSLGGGCVTGQERSVVADVHKYSWEPGETHSTFDFSHECVPVMCRDFTPKVDPYWINCSSDQMHRFSLLCADGSDEVSSCDVSLGLFDYWAYYASQVFTLMCLEVD